MSRISRRMSGLSRLHWHHHGKNACNILWRLLNSLSICVVTPRAGAAVQTEPTTQTDEVNNYILEQMRKDNIPGLSLVVVKGGKTLKARGYDLANLELQVAATADTVYEIGSITKQFTATAIMMLVEQGKLNLIDTIRKYVKGTPQQWKDVTVRHLLSHTSGIKPYTAVPGFERITVLPTTHAEMGS